jgi:hypothetical protein
MGVESTEKLGRADAAPIFRAILAEVVASHATSGWRRILGQERSTTIATYTCHSVPHTSILHLATLLLDSNCLIASARPPSPPLASPLHPLIASPLPLGLPHEILSPRAHGPLALRDTVSSSPALSSVIIPKQTSPRHGFDHWEGD